MLPEPKFPDTHLYQQHDGDTRADPPLRNKLFKRECDIAVCTMGGIYTPFCYKAVNKRDANQFSRIGNFYVCDKSDSDVTSTTHKHIGGPRKG